MSYCLTPYAAVKEEVILACQQNKIEFNVRFMRNFVDLMYGEIKVSDESKEIIKKRLLEIEL